MIIDFHVHIRENRGNVKEFLKAMDKYNIDMAVVHPIVPGDDEMGYSDNAFVGRLVKEYPDRLMGFACVVPQEENAVYQLEKAVGDYHLKGLKLHPALQGYSTADPAMYKMAEACVKLDIPMLVHTGIINYGPARIANCDSLPLDDLAIRYPECKLIIAHGNPLGIDPSMVAKHTNVYIDTTNTFSRYVRMLPSVGPMAYERMRKSDRILYGTDANPLNADKRIPFNLEPLLTMDISEEDREKLLYKNAMELLKM